MLASTLLLSLEQVGLERHWQLKKANAAWITRKSLANDPFVF